MAHLHLLHFLCMNCALHDLLLVELCKRDVKSTGGLALHPYAAHGYEPGVRSMLSADVDVEFSEFSG